MQITVPEKLPVYGYARRKDGTLERKLAAYITTTSGGYPVMEIKHERKIVQIDLPVLVEQLRSPNLRIIS